LIKIGGNRFRYPLTSCWPAACLAGTAPAGADLAGSGQGRQRPGSHAARSGRSPGSVSARSRRSTHTARNGPAGGHCR